MAKIFSIYLSVQTATTENKRYILHMDLDAFFVSVEIRKDPSLRGKPVIIGAKSDRGVVASCSYEARKYGIRSAMSSKVAAALCPHAIFIPGNMSEYVSASREVTGILREQAPLVEKASIDEHYIDLTGMDVYHDPLLFSQHLRTLIMTQTSLPVSFGLSVNKTIAKMATNACKPNGELFIPQKDILSFIGPMLIDKIPGLGKKTAERLRSIGVFTIKQLSALSEDSLVNLFGKSGTVLFLRSRGIDESPVSPYHKRKSYSIQRTLVSDTSDLDYLKNLLSSMAAELAFDLRQSNKQATTLAVIIRYADFVDETKQRVIEPTAFDYILAREANDIINEMYTGIKKVRLIGLRVASLREGTIQLGLFENSTNKIKLYKTMDEIKQRFGIKSIKMASSLDLRK